MHEWLPQDLVFTFKISTLRQDWVALMSKPIAIVLGEPNSIFSEILFKIELLKKKNFLPFFLIGNFNLIKKQSLYLKFNLNYIAFISKK